MLSQLHPRIHQIQGTDPGNGGSGDEIKARNQDCAILVTSDPVADPKTKLTPEVRTSNVGPTASSSSSSTNTKLEGEKPLAQRSALEDNTALGVVGPHTSNNKDQKEDKASLGSGSRQSEQREQEKK
ncbi:hypothetical protein Tco_0877926 [Tanacetum coccineum]|uniref:Uncharacterized protein n=1 Tax=Tanacetum coccineum TaxID=301880 RepID=A0ABQ5BWJ3_9ASTR